MLSFSIHFAFPALREQMNRKTKQKNEQLDNTTGIRHFGV